MIDSRVRTVTGRGLPLVGDDIDTDRIMPARHLRAITFDGLERHLFGDDRTHAAAQGAVHPIDDPRFSGASVLVVNRNFGCGSSREHAPQGIVRWGIRAVVGESFAEIFFGNSVMLGLPAVAVHRYYPHMRMYGGDAAIPLPYVTLKTEAAYFASRLNSKTLPVNLLVPDGVTIRTVVAPPAVSAPATAVVIVNSATLSEVGRFGRKSRPLTRMKLS